MGRNCDRLRNEPGLLLPQRLDERAHGKRCAAVQRFDDQATIRPGKYLAFVSKHDTGHGHHQYHQPGDHVCAEVYPEDGLTQLRAQTDAQRRSKL